MTESNYGYYFEDLEPGMQASFSKTVTEADIGNFAGVTGDFNPLHVNAEFARTTRFQARVAHGMLTAGMVSAVLGMRLPGPGAIYVKQQMRFHAPVFIGDTVTARVSVLEKDPGRQRVTMRTACLVRDRVVLEGEAILVVDCRGQEPALIHPERQEVESS